MRDAAPDLPLLFGNVGAVQLNYGVGADEVRAALEAVGADALNLHLNALQEAVQPEGDTRFSGLGPKIATLIEELGDVPVFAKEVGAGVGLRASRKLAALPLAGVEAAGVGGTSWAKVESYRAGHDTPQAVVGRRLAGFGFPTSEAIQYCRAAFGDRPVIGSGGIRTGMDIAVSIALGADATAMARPLLLAAEQSEVHGGARAGDADLRAAGDLLLHRVADRGGAAGCAHSGRPVVRARWLPAEGSARKSRRPCGRWWPMAT